MASNVIFREYEIVRARKNLEQAKGKRDQLVAQRDEAVKKITALSRELKNTEQAQLIIQTVGKQTQDELIGSVSDIVSSALASIFKDPYTFCIEFVSRKNRTEADVYFERDGERVSPLQASGGGAVDVAAFALRIALWSLKRPRPANTIVLDEPFRFLSRELQPKAGEMLKALSEKLKIQFVVITHNQDIADCADRIFRVENIKGNSNVIPA